MALRSERSPSSTSRQYHATFSLPDDITGSKGTHIYEAATARRELRTGSSNLHPRCRYRAVSDMGVCARYRSIGVVLRKPVELFLDSGVTGEIGISNQPDLVHMKQNSDGGAVFVVDVGVSVVDGEAVVTVDDGGGAASGAQPSINRPKPSITESTARRTITLIDVH